MLTFERLQARRLLSAAPGDASAMLRSSTGGEGESGDVTVVIGDHELLPDRSGQEITVFVSGGAAVQGVEFNLQVADGGPALGGIADGPAIQDIDILTGTIFSGNNLGGGDEDGAHPDSYPQIEWRSTPTESGTVLAEGLLATVTIDTTGFASGSWALSARDTINGPTRFPASATVVLDGTITIVAAENLPPVAMDDWVTTERGVPLAIDVLRDNGSGADWDDGQITGPPTVTETCQHGTVAIDPLSGLAWYEPQPGYTGLDYFAYKIVDDRGAVSNRATVTVKIVKPANGRGLTSSAAGDAETSTVAALDTAMGDEGDPVATLQSTRFPSRGQTRFSAHTVPGAERMLPVRTVENAAPLAAVAEGLAAGVAGEFSDLLSVLAASQDGNLDALSVDGFFGWLGASHKMR